MGPQGGAWWVGEVGSWEFSVELGVLDGRGWEGPGSWGWREGGGSPAPGVTPVPPPALYVAS